MPFIYRNPRPHLTIEHVASRQIRNCYRADTWRVTSTRKLSREALIELNRARVLGFGQEFEILSQCDSTEAPAGIDVIQCVAVDDEGNVLADVPAVNPYTGKPYGPSSVPYFVYECESRVDSGD